LVDEVDVDGEAERAQAADERAALPAGRIGGLRRRPWMGGIAEDALGRLVALGGDRLDRVVHGRAIEERRPERLGRLGADHLAKRGDQRLGAGVLEAMAPGVAAD